MRGASTALARRALVISASSSAAVILYDIDCSGMILFHETTDDDDWDQQFVSCNNMIGDGIYYIYIM